MHIESGALEQRTCAGQVPSAGHEQNRPGASRLQERLHPNGFFPRRVDSNFREDGLRRNPVKARLLGANVGFGRSSAVAPAQENQSRREPSPVELDAAIGPTQRFEAEHAGGGDPGAQHHDGVRRHEVRADGRLLVQPIRERGERGDEKADDSDETDQTPHTVAGTACRVHAV